MKRRTLVFTLLYASEGAPIGFLWWALPTLLRREGLEVPAITALTATLVLPWVLKFLWAPVLDVVRNRWWGYRQWVVVMQVLMALTLVPLAWLDPVTELRTWHVLLLLHAIAAATQDVAIDALAISLTPPHERGRLNGAMQAGMLVGRSIFGGGAVLIAASTGLSAVILTLAAWIVIPLVAVTRLPEARTPDATPGEAPRGLALLAMFRERSTWIGLAFALTGAAAFEVGGQLAGPFLVDRHVSDAVIGTFFSVAVVAATLLGGLVGGWWSDRRGRRSALRVFVMAVSLVVALLGVLDAGSAVSGPMALVLLTAMFVGVGLFTATSYAYFMDLTHRRLGATQFSTFMAGTNACESWTVWAAGLAVGRWGYSTAFLVAAGVSLSSLLWLRPSSTRDNSGHD